jgi:hypothetical protein
LSSSEWRDERAEHPPTENKRELEASYIRFTRVVLKSARQAIPNGNRFGGNLPFWNRACDEAVAARDAAQLAAVRAGHTDEDVAAHVAAAENCRMVIATEQRSDFKSALSELRPGDNLWRTVAAMDGRSGGPKASATIARPGNAKPAATDSEKARLFCQTYAAASHVTQRPDDRPLKRECCRALRSRCGCQGDRTEMCCPFGRAELEAAIRKLRNGKCAGTDELPNELLKAIPDVAREELLRLINISWSLG